MDIVSDLERKMIVLLVWCVFKLKCLKQIQTLVELVPIKIA